MAGEGADERALAALGAQVRVDREDGALGGGALADPDQPRRQPGGGAEGGLLRGLLVGGLGHEDHVDVAGVVELAGAALAHRHDRQPGGRGRGRLGRVLGRQLGPGHRQGRLEHGVGQVGQLGRGLVDRDHAGQVAGGQVQQAAAVGGGEPGRPGRSRPSPTAGDRDRVVGVGADRAQQLGPELARLGAAVRVPAAQDGAVCRVPGQVSGQGLADAEDGNQPGAERGSWSGRR